MKVAVIGGDGIGPEVMAEGLKVLNAVRSDVETTDFDLGARRYLRNGELLTDGDLEALELVGHASRIDAAAHRLDAAVAGALAQQAHDATTRARDDAARMVETASEYEAIEARSADVWAEEI